MGVGTKGLSVPDLSLPKRQRRKPSRGGRRESLLPGSRLTKRQVNLSFFKKNRPVTRHLEGFDIAQLPEAALPREGRWGCAFGVPQPGCGEGRGPTQARERGAPGLTRARCANERSRSAQGQQPSAGRGRRAPFYARSYANEVMSPRVGLTPSRPGSKSASGGPTWRLGGPHPRPPMHPNRNGDGKIRREPPTPTPSLQHALPHALSPFYVYFAIMDFCNSPQSLLLGTRAGYLRA